MRTLLRASVDHSAGNAAIKDGRLGRIMQDTIQRLRPEASYFTAYGGKRTAYFVFDLADPSEIPSIAEPFFQELNADLEFSPVMDATDLKNGLDKIAAQRERTPAGV